MKLSPALLLLAASCCAATIDTDTICTIAGETVSAPAHCSLSSGPLAISASSGGSLWYTGDVGAARVVSIAEIDGVDSDQYFGRSVTSLAFSLASAGPARDGFALIDIYLSGLSINLHNATERASATVAGISVEYPDRLAPGPVPFQLGTSFAVSLWSEAVIFGAYGRAEAEANVWIWLYERNPDGSLGAAVQIFETPEPGTWVMLVTGLAIVVLRRRQGFEGEKAAKPHRR
jgi:hypothetical protein